jgi:hypothetical protein
VIHVHVPAGEIFPVPPMPASSIPAMIKDVLQRNNLIQMEVSVWAQTRHIGICITDSWVWVWALVSLFICICWMAMLLLLLLLLMRS